MAEMENQVSGIKNRVQQMGNAAADKTQKVADSVASGIRETTSKAGERIEGAASSAAQKISDATSSVGHKLEEATQAVGTRMESLGHAIHEGGANYSYIAPASNMLGDSLEEGGRYLQEEGLEGIGADIATLIRRNPIPSLLAGLCIGYFVGRAMRT